MNRANGGQRAVFDEELFDSLLLAYDEALASGTAPQDVEETRIPADVLRELEGAQEFLRLVDRARRFRQESTDGPSGTADGSLPLPADDRAASHATHRIGPFQIIRELGRGGYGVVFLALDRRLERHVALKVARPEITLAPKLSERFLREAKAAGSLAHPNLVAVYEVGEDGPFCFIASAYCQGPTLAQWLHSRTAPVSLGEAAQLIAELADGVEHAHRVGVLHRDIKPSNILLEPRAGGDGEAETRFTPKLTDFGLARLADGDGATTRGGAMLGTASYMAPEQATGRLHEMGPPTDVYGLGTVLYELLTGQRAFQGAGDVDTVRRVVTDEPVSPRRLRTDLPRDLEAICQKCLEKRPDQRYASAALLAQDLRNFLAGKPTLARPLGSTQKLVRWANRRPALAALLCVSLASAAALVVGLVWHSATLTAALTVSDERREFAEKMRMQAERSGRAALQQEKLASQHLYASQMNLAYAAAEQGDVVTANQLLDQYQPPARWSELRGFEWFYLQRHLHKERIVRHAHDEVYAAAYSPDDEILATGGQDGDIRFWNPLDATERATLKGHNSCVNSLAFTPNGSLLASGSCDNTVRLWSVETRQELATLLAYEHFISAVSFSRDNTWLASIADDGAIVVWDVAARSAVARLRTEGDGWIAWSPDSSLLVGGSTGGPCRIWEAGTWKELATIPVGTLAGVFCQDSRTMAIVTVDQSLELWDTRTQHLRSVLQPRGVRKTLRISPSDQWLLSSGGFNDQLFRLWDLNDPAFLTNTRESATEQLGQEQPSAKSHRILIGHTAAVKDAAFSHDDATAVTVSRDGMMRLWDVQDIGVSVPLLRCGARSVAMNDDLTRIAVCNGSGGVEAWDLADVRSPASLPIPTSPAMHVDRVALMPDGSSLICISMQDGEACVLDLAGESSRQTLIGHQGGITKYALSANGRSLVTQGYDRVVRVQDPATGEQTFSVEVPSQTTSLKQDRLDMEGARVAITPDGNQLLVSGWPLGQAAARIIDLNTKESYPIEAPFDGATISPDGRFLAGVVFSTGVQIVDLASRKVTSTLHMHSTVTAMAFSPDGRTLATGSPDGKVSLWHVASSQEMATLGSFTGVVRFLKFSADGSRLAAVITGPAPDGDKGPSSAELYIWRSTGD